MDYELPEFEKRKKHEVMAFARSVFGSSLVQLHEYNDGHFRAVFERDYFVLQDGNDAPSRSQWSTLKKKLKRRDRSTFVFKETGTTSCRETGEETCYYLDFGFFLY